MICLCPLGRYNFPWLCITSISSISVHLQTQIHLLCCKRAWERHCHSLFSLLCKMLKKEDKRGVGIAFIKDKNAHSLTCGNNFQLPTWTCPKHSQESRISKDPNHMFILANSTESKTAHSNCSLPYPILFFPYSQLGPSFAPFHSPYILQYLTHYNHTFKIPYSWFLHLLSSPRLPETTVQIVGLFQGRKLELNTLCARNMV